MDTSETYIKMCEKVTTMQKDWKPQEGDWIFTRGGRTRWGNMENHTIPDEVLVLASRVMTIKQGASSLIAIPMPGELHAQPLSIDSLTIADTKTHYFSGFPLKYFTWLPRQDQLQEMAGEKPIWKLLQDFLFWFSASLEIQARATIQEWTGEQLWMAFVMHEKYGKVWNGEDWVKLNG